MRWKKCKQAYLEVKIKLRKFETLKPFLMWPAREKDKRSCLCRKHVEMQIVCKRPYEIKKGSMPKEWFQCRGSQPDSFFET